MSTSTSWKPRAILMLVSLAVAAALGEAALRIVLVRLPVPFLIYLNPAIKNRVPETWERVREWVPTLNLRQEDAEAGWTFKPGITVSGKNEDGEPYEVTTSPEGFFTPDVPAKSTPQLVTVGASFLSTIYVRQPLEDVLRAKLGVPIYNLSVGGWGPDSFAGAYGKFATGRRHDLAVVFTTAADMASVDNWNAWKAEGTSESFLTWTQRRGATDDSVNRGGSWPDTHLVLWNLAKFALRRPPASAPTGAQPLSALIMPADASKMERFEGGGRPFDLQFNRGQLFMEHEAPAFLPGGAYYPYMQAYFESLVRLEDRIARNGARMVLVWIPLKEEVYLPLLPRERQAAYLADPSRDIRGLNEAVKRFAGQEGVSFLDLTDPLVERARTGDKLYFTVDGHFNSHGNEVAGELVADFIGTLPSQPPPPMPEGTPLYYRRGPVSIERALTAGAMSSHASIVRPSAEGWTARGRAESRFGYLAQWPVSQVAAPQWLVARGVVRRGGVTVGLLQDDKWALQYNIARPGAFDVALPVSVSGSYTVVIAADLPEDSLDIDVDVTALGWAPIGAAAPAR